MSHSGFELLGHDNPLGRYPGPVVPVGKVNGQLVVVFAGTDGPELLNASDNEEYVRYDEFLAAKFRDFDYSRDRLFAFDENNVAYYQIDNEERYFEQLLRDADFSQENPFLRLSLAKIVSAPDVLIEELYGCVATLRRSAAEEFMDDWYKRERETLLLKIDRRYHFRLPETWKVLTRIQESKKPVVARPHRGFLSHSSSQSHGGMAAGAAMGTALVVVAMFNTRESVDAAYSLLLKQDYHHTDVSLLLLRTTFVNMFPELQRERVVAEKALAENSIAQLLMNPEYANLSGLKLVCAGPYAKNFGGVTGSGMSVHLVAGLQASGLTEDQARLCEEGIRHGSILMGVSSISEADASYFENEWIK